MYLYKLRIIKKLPFKYLNTHFTVVMQITSTILYDKMNTIHTRRTEFNIVETYSNVSILMIPILSIVCTILSLVFNVLHNTLT